MEQERDAAPEKVRPPKKSAPNKKRGKAKKPKTGRKGGKEGRNRKLGETRRKKFLEAIARGLNKSKASKQVGVNIRSINRLEKEDPAFREAVVEAELSREGKVEDALFRAANKGNVVAIQVWLYNRAPKRWRDRRNFKNRDRLTPEEQKKFEAERTKHLNEAIEFYRKVAEDETEFIDRKMEARKKLDELLGLTGKGRDDF